MNCKQHGEPVVRVVKSTGKGLCNDCLTTGYVNIERQRLQAQKTLNDLCRQFEDQQRVFQQIRKKLECNSSNQFEQRYSLPSLQGILQQKTDQLSKEFNIELQNLINSYGELTVNDPRMLEATQKVEALKTEQRKMLRMQLRNDVQRFFTKYMFRG